MDWGDQERLQEIGFEIIFKVALSLNMFPTPADKPHEGIACLFCSPLYPQDRTVPDTQKMLPKQSLNK